jgi:PAS domain S-box-containing protein
MVVPAFSLEPPARIYIRNKGLRRLLAISLALMSVFLIAWPVWNTNLFSSDFLPHRFCYLSNSRLITLHLICDLMIFVAYTTISVVLAYLVYRARRHIPFHWVFLAFGAFIVACGFTHLMEVVVLWKAVYWLAGEVKLVTAIASVLTAAVLPPLAPRMLAMVNAARLSEQHKLDLQHANLELASLNARLTELDALKSQFFANVSHELRTPLMLIETPAERVISSPGLQESERSDLELIQRSARQLRKHVDDLLDAARLEAGRMAVRYERVDLAGLVRLIASDFEAVSSDRGLRFTISAPQSLPARTDGEKFARIVLNLLSNGFKFTPSGGQVLCELSAAGEHAQLIVEDSGPGIPAEMREAIFERFRQVEGGANRRFGGTGLGLSIVKDFVELQQGSVSVDQSPLGGARFTVRLPLQPGGSAGALVETEDESALRYRTPVADASDAEHQAARVTQRARAEVDVLGHSASDEQVKAHAASESVDSALGAAPLILIVEDSRDLNRLLAESLAGQYRVEVAHDSVTGLRKAEQLRPDLVLTDIMMPGMSGDELVTELRHKSELDDLPIMVLTAKADPQLRVDLLTHGVQDYLVKPFSMAEMHARIANLISVRRTRQLLREELQSNSRNVVELAQQLAEQRRWVVTTLNSIGDAVITTDNSGCVQFVNRAAEALLGIGSNEIVGRHAEEVVFLEQESTNVDDPAGSALDFGQTRDTRMHLLVLPGSGKRVPVEDSVALILDPDGKRQGAVMVLRDITARLAVEQALRRSERLAAAGRTAATIAHEINNPLEAVTNLIFLAKMDSKIGPEARGFLETADRELARIAHMTKQTLGFYRDSAPPSRFNVAATIESVLEIYAPRITQKGVNLEKQLESGAEAFGSSQEFQQVCANLILNALDAMEKKGGRLLIRSRRQSDLAGHPFDGVRISIADTGKGIPLESREKVFEAFYTTKNSVGMGLGLWVSRELVEKQGGTIRVRSRINPQQSGTVFSIFWPSQPVSVRETRIA